MFSFNAIYIQLFKGETQKRGNRVLHLNKHVCQRSCEGFGFLSLIIPFSWKYAGILLHVSSVYKTYGCPLSIDRFHCHAIKK